MEDKKKGFVSVEIMGVSYRLKKTEDEDYLREVAARVDGLMKEISEKHPVISSDRIAVLAAMRLCDEWLKDVEERKREDAGVKSVIEELSESLKNALKK